MGGGAFSFVASDRASHRSRRQTARKGLRFECGNDGVACPRHIAAVSAARGQRRAQHFILRALLRPSGFLGAAVSREEGRCSRGLVQNCGTAWWPGSLPRRFANRIDEVTSGRRGPAMRSQGEEPASGMASVGTGRGKQIPHPFPQTDAARASVRASTEISPARPGASQQMPSVSKRAQIGQLAVQIARPPKASIRGPDAIGCNCGGIGDDHRGPRSVAACYEGCGVGHPSRNRLPLDE